MYCISAMGKSCALAYSIFDRDFNFLWTQRTKIAITVDVQHFSFTIRLHKNSFDLQKARVASVN